MLFIRSRDARGLLHQRQIPGALYLGHLDAPLDVTNGRKILVEFGAVARSDPSLDASGLVGHRVENAAVLSGSGQPRGRGRAVSVSNSRSKTTRGLFSIGNGVVGLCQEIVLV